MSIANLGQIVAEQWQRTLKETPDPFNTFVFGPPFGSVLSYRDRLDLQARNCFGELIPRIVTVRRNLARLKRGG